MADLGFLSHLPELCDVTFMVGVEKVNNKINNLGVVLLTTMEYFLY